MQLHVQCMWKGIEWFLIECHDQRQSGNYLISFCFGFTMV